MSKLSLIITITILWISLLLNSINNNIILHSIIQIIFPALITVLTMIYTSYILSGASHRIPP